MPAITRPAPSAMTGAAAASAAGAPQASGSAAAPPAGRRPNILLIMTDQQSAAAMGCTGNPHLRTPALDALAAAGMRFDQAYCSNPICVPSRTSLFTGLMGHQSGVVNNDMQAFVAGTCLGRRPTEAGYRTGYTGKWHIPHDIKDRAWSGFDVLSAVHNHGVDGAIPAACEAFLSQRDPQKPFLLVASFLNPHDICQIARRLGGSATEVLGEGEIGDPPPLAQRPPLPANAGIASDEPEAIRLHQRLPRNARLYPTRDWDAARWRAYLWSYYRLVEQVDRQIGLVLQSLRDHGCERDTVVIFTSDHGGGMGAHGWNQKTIFCEEAVRVPFIIAQVGTIAAGGSDRRALVSTGIDLAATCLGIAGLAIPAELRGQDLYAYALGRTATTHPCIVAQNDLGVLTPGGRPVHGRMLRSPRCKYVVYDGGAKPEQLFDLESDPGEMRNLAYRPEAAETLAEHRRMLAQWLAASGDPFMAERESRVTQSQPAGSTDRIGAGARTILTAVAFAACWCLASAAHAGDADINWPDVLRMGGHGTALAWPEHRREPVAGKAWACHVVDNSISGADGVKLGDVNGDGLPDIVTGWEEGGQTRLYLNPGPQRAMAAWPFVAVGKTPGAEDALIADLDGDGVPDVITCCEDQQRTIFVHWGPRNRSDLTKPERWEQAILTGAPKGGFWMFASAMQVDGRNGLDLIAGGKKGQPKELGWLEAPAAPRDLAAWTWHPIAPAQWTMDLWQRDMDGNGTVDLVLTDRRTCCWLENPGPGPAQAKPWTVHLMGATKGKSRETMFCGPGDLDGDGLEDWVVGIGNYEILWLRRMDASGLRWEQHSIVVNAGNGYIKAAVICDLNGDGRPDIAFTGSSTRNLHGCMWLENTGDPRRASEWPVHTISGDQSGQKWDRIEMVDLNGDGAPDLLTTEEGNDREREKGLGVVWFENPFRRAKKD